MFVTWFNVGLRVFDISIPTGTFILQYTGKVLAKDVSNPATK
jgi:hypothetical protein